MFPLPAPDDTGHLVSPLGAGPEHHMVVEEDSPATRGGGEGTLCSDLYRKKAQNVHDIQSEL